jgi:hypothetical protein
MYQVQTKADLFNATYVLHLQDEEHQVEDITGFVSCECDTMMARVCIRIVTVAFNIFASLGPQKIFRIFFIYRHFVGSSFKSVVQ